MSTATLSVPPVEIIAAAASELAEAAQTAHDLPTMRATNKAALQFHKGTAPVRPSAAGYWKAAPAPASSIASACRTVARAKPVSTAKPAGMCS
jgi:hypothetical protein